MSTNRTRSLRLFFALVASLAFLAGLLALADQAGPPVYAATLEQVTAWTPAVTITQPAPHAILTRTPQLIQMTYRCGTLCLGTAQVSAVSITLDGDAGPYHPASPAISETWGGLYTYTWSLEAQDYVAHVLRARARNAWGNVGASAPLTVFVDTLPPRETVITSPAYTEGPGFPVSWSATDGSGVVRYDLQYRRDDQPTWTDWLTHSSATSQTFPAPGQTALPGHVYELRMRARDQGHNLSGWVTSTTRLGPYSVYLPFIVRGYPPPWRQGTGSPGLSFRTPWGCGDTTWYAGTSAQGGVWQSTDDARTWSRISDLQPDAYPVVANPADCRDAFVSVWGKGIYRLAGTAAPTAINNNLGELYLYGLTLTGTTLYAGTNSFGVYKTGIDAINWQAANSGIPDLRIRSLYALGSRLYAGGRGCAVYISSDGGATWGVQIVLTAGCNDAQVWSVAQVQQTLYAGLGGGHGLYYLDGILWGPVAGLPAGNVYGLAFDAAHGYLYASVYGSGVYRCRLDSEGKTTTCSAHNLGLATLDTREIHIHDGLLVAGSDDGVWYRPLLP
jgi:hypothetical protein